MASERTIEDLRVAISHLEDQQRAIREQLRALVASLRYFEGLGEHSEPQPPRTDSAARPKGFRTAGPSGTRADVVYQVLDAAGGPLRKQEIMSKLEGLGVRIGGAHPLNSLGAHLSMDNRFKNVGRATWDLTERTNTDQLDDEEEETLPW